jgi:hypothetical protein
MFPNVWKRCFVADEGFQTFGNGVFVVMKVSKRLETYFFIVNMIARFEAL